MSVASILKAIDEEHRELCRGAQAIYSERMKAPRAALDGARAEFERQKAIFQKAEQANAEDLRANLAEAQSWRDDARSAAESRPAKPAQAIPSVAHEVVASGRSKVVSLPRVSILERHSA